MSVNNILRIVRELRFSRSEAASLLGVSTSRFDAWKNGRPDYAPPSPAVLKRAAALVDRRIAALRFLLSDVSSPPVDAPHYRTLAEILALLPYSRRETAAALGITVERLGAFADGRAKRAPSAAVMARAKALFLEHARAVEALRDRL